MFLDFLELRSSRSLTGSQQTCFVIRPFSKSVDWLLTGEERKERRPPSYHRLAISLSRRVGLTNLNNCFDSTGTYTRTRGVGQKSGRGDTAIL